MQGVWLYDFSKIHRPKRSEYNPVERECENKILKIKEVQYDQVYSDKRENVYIFVRRLDRDKLERASTMKANSVTISKIEVPRPKNDPPPLDIMFNKLISSAYVFMQNYNSLNKIITTPLQQMTDREETLLDLQKEWGKVEAVQLKKELDRTEIFFEELKRKIDGEDLEVEHEYGTLGNDSNCYSLCGTSRIDIVLSNKKAKLKGDIYIAGAVMEMKTHRRKAENEAQTAYEMMKFGTDKFIKHMLRQGNVSVNKVVVFGILVDMDETDGVVMELEMDFQTETAKCTKDRRGTVSMRNAFQLIRERLL